VKWLSLAGVRPIRPGKNLYSTSEWYIIKYNYRQSEAKEINEVRNINNDLPERGEYINNNTKWLQGVRPKYSSVTVLCASVLVN
jgi:hypothetical protein